MANHRVVVTGSSVMTSLGNDVDALWDFIGAEDCVLRSGSMDAESIESKPLHQRTVDFEPQSFPCISTAVRRRADRFAHLAIATAQSAVTGSRLEPGTADRSRIGVAVGSAFGGQQSIEKQASLMRERGPKRVSAFFVPSLMVNSAAGHVAMAFDLQGPSLGVNDGCASASAAIGTGLRLIRHSAVDVILCGGAEASLTDAVLHGLRSEGIADATGLPSTEAAGILILESLSSAQQRHATILAELRGYGQSSSAGDLSPDATAMASVRSLTAALNDACLRWCDIDWVIVNLPAPMPPDNPVWRAMTSMFQSDGDVPVMDELTVPFGRLFGATGAVFSAIGVEAIDRRMLPSRRLHEDRAGLRRPDSANANAATANVKNVLVHNVSITGSCASLLYSRFDED